ncbi:hypothetical protein TNCV_539981 [Trichonephila clavipes]|nr:hypothetical protein TNCV_539981 [Trichonephila clavipes]
MYSAFLAWDTLNSRRAASPLVRLVEGKKEWEVFDHSHGIFLPNWVGTAQNRIVTCMVFKAYASRKNLAFSRNEFRGH